MPDRDGCDPEHLTRVPFDFSSRDRLTADFQAQVLETGDEEKIDT
jgi:hypothetical protein